MTQRSVGEPGGGRPEPVHGNVIHGGHFHAPVIQAQEIDQLVVEQRLSRRDYLFVALTAVTLLAMGVFLGTGGGELGPGPTARWAALGCVALAPVLVIALVVHRRRQLRRLYLQVPEPTLRQAAEALAKTLTRQYAQEVAHSRVNDPKPITVRWRPAETSLSDHRATYAAGAEDITLDGEFAQIEQQFSRLPRGRLVVLGAPGSGKSVLVLQLARRLLQSRAPKRTSKRTSSKRTADQPVPVVLPLSSWNPRLDPSLWWWAAGTLAEAQPAAFEKSRAPSRAVAHQLITSGLVLPILDGFDELPRRARAEALRQLRNSLTDDGQFVLTSRIAAYTETVEEADLRLPGTAAIELSPLTVADVQKYLPDSSRPGANGRTKWHPVMARLADPLDDDPAVRLLRTVLRTPLMVSLARTAYSDTTADPADLLHPGEFRSAHDLQRHLLGAFVDAVYAPHSTAVPGQGPNWTPVQARRWLAGLARRQQRTGDQDIAWWRMDRLVPRRARMLLSLPMPPLLALAVGVAGVPRAEDALRLPLPMPLVVLIGGLGALIADWCVTSDADLPVPQRIRRPRADEVRAALRRPVWAVPLGLGGLVIAGLWTVQVAWGGAGTITTVVVWTAIALFVLLLALRNALRLPADPESRDPLTLLHEDRHATLTLALFSLPGSPYPLRAHKFLLGAVLAAVLLWGLLRGQEAMGLPEWGTALVAVLAAVGVWSCAVSAWGRFGATRLWLSVGGQLPRDLSRFLQDAHQRGVLRQTGGYYRFRHLELQNELASWAGESGASASGASASWASDRRTPGGAVDEAEDRPDPERAGLARRRVQLQESVVTGLGMSTALFAAFVLLTGALSGPASVGPVATLRTACELLTPHDLRPALQDPAVIASRGNDSRDIRAPKTITWGYPHPSNSVSSCVLAEQAPFRPETTVTVAVGLFAARAAGGTSSEGAEQWLRQNIGLGHVVRKRLGDSAFVGEGQAIRSVPDPVAEYPSSSPFLPMGVARARVANAVVAVDISQEFSTPARLRQMAEILARTVLHRAGLTGTTPPGQPALKDVPQQKLAERSRFGLYRRVPVRRLEGAVWQGEERSTISLFDISYGNWMPLRVPRGMECTYPREDEEHDNEDSVRCTSGKARYRTQLDLVVYDCDDVCTARDRSVFYSRRPDQRPDSWPRHDPYTRYQRAQSGDREAVYLVRSLRTWLRFGKQRIPEDHFLWLRVTSSVDGGRVAEKVVNDAFSQLLPREERDGRDGEG